MTDRKLNALKLRSYLDGLSDDEFVSRVNSVCPGFIRASLDSEANMSESLTLYQLSLEPVQLQAYMAGALTGLNEDQRQAVFFISDKIHAVCERNAIDLYEPRKKTDPVHHPWIQNVEVFRTDQRTVLNSDLLIYLGNYPSAGAGEEIAFAVDSLLPVILVASSDTKMSRMVTGIPGLKWVIRYEDPDDLESELDALLARIRPILEERKLAFSDMLDTNLVGERVRVLREQLGLTYEEIEAAQKILTADHLRHIEESSDRESNVTLIQLRAIAAVLRTTVADLVEPDLESRLMSLLEDWMMGERAAPVAARFKSLMTPADRKRLMRRILLRLIDSLETD